MAHLAASRWAACVMALPLVIGAPVANCDQTTNVTGLPVFPSLSSAAMDQVSRTDTLGRWCSRFAAETSYPLEKVEAWYRTTLTRASETDLANDATYQLYPRLTGIKLALGIDYVTVFRSGNQSGTSIELFKCSAAR